MTSLALLLWIFCRFVLLASAYLGTKRAVDKSSCVSWSTFTSHPDGRDDSNTQGNEDKVGIRKRRRRIVAIPKRDMEEVLRRRSAREELASARAKFECLADIQMELKMSTSIHMTQVKTKNQSLSVLSSSSGSISSNSTKISTREEENTGSSTNGRKIRSKNNKLVYGVGKNDVDYAVMKKTFNKEDKKWVVTRV